MIGSTLRYPKGDRYLRIYSSLLNLCKGNACAAALLNFFESWHRYKLQESEYAALYNAMAKEAGTGSIIDTSGWQYHTMEQLERGVMLYREGTIRPAIKFLEASNFINTEVPDRLRILHKTGRTMWFLLLADNINIELDKMENSLAPPRLVFPPPRQPREKTEPKTATGKYAEDAAAVFEYRSKRRVQFWAKRGKKMRAAVGNVKELALLMDRLKEGFTVGQLAQAFEGNLASDYHQGFTDKNQTVYDSIGLVYRDAANVNRFIGIAEQHGITLRAVQRLLQGGSVPAGAPTASQEVPVGVKYAAYHQRLAWQLAPWVYTAGRVLVASDIEAAFKAKYEPDTPLDLAAVAERIGQVVKDKAGTFNQMHQHNLGTILDIVEGVINGNRE